LAGPRQPVPTWMRPLWVRLLFVLAPAAWAVVEGMNAQGLWAMLFGATAVWGFWTLIVKYEEPKDPKAPPGEGG
jgi:hypothetical protein